MDCIAVINVAGQEQYNRRRVEYIRPAEQVQLTHAPAI